MKDYDLRAFAIHALREHNDSDLAKWLESGAPGALPYERERVVRTIHAIARMDYESEGRPVPRFDALDGDNEYNLRGRLLATLYLATRESPLRRRHTERADAAAANRPSPPAQRVYTEHDRQCDEAWKRQLRGENDGPGDTSTARLK